MRIVPLLTLAWILQAEAVLGCLHSSSSAQPVHTCMYEAVGPATRMHGENGAQSAVNRGCFTGVRFPIGMAAVRILSRQPGLVHFEWIQKQLPTRPPHGSAPGKTASILSAVFGAAGLSILFLPIIPVLPLLGGLCCISALVLGIIGVRRAGANVWNVSGIIIGGGFTLLVLLFFLSFL